MASTLGTKSGLSGIPSLLISDLASVKDPVVQRALYQVQNFANSIGSITAGALGAKTATLGTQYPGDFTIPVTWTQVSWKGTRAWMPVWV
jgi:hypothetical protein